MHIAYLLTGGNLGNRHQNLMNAKKRIDTDCGPVLTFSEIYETEAWGLHDQSPFLNQAIAINTTFSPQDLLKKILGIEKRLGRTRDVKFGPRIIDIDIIFYENLVVEVPGLSIPHPQLQYRRFALECLNDIAADFIHPVLKQPVWQILKKCKDPLKVKKWA